MSELRNPFAERSPYLFLCIIGPDYVKYARACTIDAKEYYVIPVPLKDGIEDRSGLSPDELTFVVHNLTPAERAAGLCGANAGA